MRSPIAPRRALAGLSAAALCVGLWLPAAGATDGDGPLTPAQRQALEAGIQIAPKGATTPKGAPRQPNPYLADQPDLTKVDYGSWRQKMLAAGKARAKSARLADNRRRAVGTAAALPPAFVHDEEEPSGTAGSNDSVANSERIPQFGVTGTGKNNRVRILGSLASIDVSDSDLDPVPEDNGSIPLAGDTGISGSGQIETTGVLGDGPHGSAGDATGDFDFYKLDVDEGLSVVADTSGSDADTLVALYDAEGNLLATDDDGGPDLTSLLTYAVPRGGTYYLAVAGFRPGGPLPGDPFDSGSGPGVGDEDSYALSLAARQIDRDLYSVRLKPGDVIGGVGKGGATGLTVWKSDGSERVGSRQDASSLYAPSSPLPGGGNTTMAYVAEEAGWYSVEVTGADDQPYDVTVEGYRPGAQTDRPRVKQTVFLDFDGQRVNSAVWGGSGVTDLSPFSAFIGKWGLNKSQEGLLIRRITAEVRENIQTDLQRKGLNPYLQVDVVNSRTSPDTFGKDNVSRVVVGGTIDQLGIDTIGISQYIDPGNYGLEDQAVVLLDVLSDRKGSFGDPSLNTYLNASSDRVAFVSQAVGNVVSHEIGHLIGSYHTDNVDDRVNLMDAGGTGFENLFGVGPDGVGGTADDSDVDFGTDSYLPNEGFSGDENTLNVSSWAFWFR
jgi:hypothetical protein